MQKRTISLKLQVFILLLFVSTAQAGTLDGAKKVDGNNVAVGLAAKALLTNSTAVGESSFATAVSSTTYGAISSATAVNTTALGTAALAQGKQSTAVGALAQALEHNSTAVGVNAMVEANDGIAVGESASVLEKGGIALGADSISDAEGAVALGSQSAAREKNTVSVGDSETGLTRRITNLAPAISNLDAVNLGQMNRGLKGVRKDAFAGIASVAALTPTTPSAQGKTAVGFGAAHYRGEQAVALSFSHRLNGNKHNMQLNGGVAYDTSRSTLGKVGVSWEF
ncbi:MAG: YadA-like family protein [Cocleimonas sp.]|nr:YadA-like family protein [Cocleimonas sp.]